jgi:hypothetical protein
MADRTSRAASPLLMAKLVRNLGGKSKKENCGVSVKINYVAGAAGHLQYSTRR